MPTNTDPFAPWNSYDKDNPFAIHNGYDRDNPFKPWNNVFGRADDLTDDEAATYGINRRH